MMKMQTTFSIWLLLNKPLGSLSKVSSSIFLEGRPKRSEAKEQEEEGDLKIKAGPALAAAAGSLDRSRQRPAG